MMSDFVNTIDLLGDEFTLKALVERTIDNFNDDVLKSVGDYAFHNCSKLTSVSLPNLTSVGEKSFYNCSKLKSVYIPKVTSINRLTFNTCSSLTSIDLSNVTSIGSGSFGACRALTSIDLSNVTSIGSDAFFACSELRSVYLPATPPTLGSSAFSSINSACVFHIPTGSLSAYQSATNWSTLTGQYSFVEEDR